jgi:hypothetical protein
VWADLLEATIDRCLRPVRCEHPHGLSTTKPGALLKKAILVRIYTAWDEDRPAFLEIDLAAYCGETAGPGLSRAFRVRILVM